MCPGLPGPGETRDGYYQPLERAELVRPGKDVTILCYSRMRYVVTQAVQQLEKQGYDPEVTAHTHRGCLFGKQLCWPGTGQRPWCTPQGTACSKGFSGA